MDDKTLHVLREVQLEGKVNISKAADAFALPVRSEEAVAQYQRDRARRRIKRILGRYGVRSYCDGRGNVIPIRTLEEARKSLELKLTQIQGRVDQYKEALRLLDEYKRLQPKGPNRHRQDENQLTWQLDGPR